MFPKRKYDFNYKAPPSIGGLTTLQDIQRISPFFTETNSLTYAIYLEANKDKLSDYEIEQTKNYMVMLMNKEKEAMEFISKHLKDKRDYEEQEHDSKSSSSSSS